MLKLKYLIMTALLILIPIQLLAASLNMAPIFAYLLSDSGSKIDDAIKSVESLNFETESVTDKLTEIKADFHGTTDKEEKVLLALIEIAEIINSAEVNALISKDSAFINLDALAGDASVTLALAASVNTAGGTDVLHTYANKLKTASDLISDAFNGDITKEFKYKNGTVVVNYDDSLAVRAQALAAASSLDLAASYSYGSAEMFRVKTEDVDGISYEYREAEIDPLTTLKQSTFFAMSNTARLAGAGDYLEESVGLAVLIDPAKVSVTDITQANIDDAIRIKDAFDGNGILESLDTSESINLHKVFSSTDYIDRNDFIIPDTYLGVSDAVVAGYDELDTYTHEYAAYEIAHCVDPESSAVEPNAPLDSMIYYMADVKSWTPRTINRDLSIKYAKPIHHKGFVSYIMINYYTCSIMPMPSEDNYIEAEIDIKEGASFKDVVVVEEDLEYTYTMVDGKTFYYKSSTMFGESYKEEVTFNGTNHTCTIKRDGVTLPVGTYEINDGILHINNNDTVNYKFEIFGDDGLFMESINAIFQTSIINTDGVIVGDQMVFETKQDLDAFSPDI